MTANLRLAWYNDHDDATLTVSGAGGEVTGFEATKTQNTIRSDVLRSVDTSTMTVSGTLPDSRVGSWLLIPRHKLNGASVQLKLYSDAAWATQVLATSTVPAPCYTASETFVSSKGSNDPFAADAPFWIFFAETTYRSYKIIVSGTPDDVAYYEIGRIRLMRYMEFARSASYGLTLGYQSIEDRARTQGGSLRGNQSAIIRTMQFDFAGINENEYASLLDAYRLAGTTGEVAVSVYPGDSDRRAALHTIAGTFSAINSVGRQVRILQNKVQLEEN
jgi:hypothetical protein